MRPLFQLGPRLALCAGFVREGTVLCDVGTDHAYLPIWLLKTGKISRALACDIRPGPLETARKDGAKYEAGEGLSFRLSDGLRQVSPEEAEDVVIAGMGGELILRDPLAARPRKAPGAAAHEFRARAAAWVGGGGVSGPGGGGCYRRRQGLFRLFCRLDRLPCGGGSPLSRYGQASARRILCGSLRPQGAAGAGRAA